ncbi:hypothetical protein FOZ61_000572 [Perkinsus olseni]|uniref:Uncharacterized protein n=1 Tax=Perkinsus olseni TaxID=32597 RepID=A0A7J6LZM4_PEROL|nr:hypothetical protein FOZ61_000572 [Perkinsus olseni]
MSQKADGNYGAGPPKLTLPITPRTLDGASSSSSGYQRGRDEEGSVDYLRESFDNDRVFGDSDEVRLEAYPTGERDSHRKRFDSFESWDSASSSCSSRDDDSNDEMELDENGLIFMSFEASHEFREMRATREVQHYGRVRVFKGPLGVVLYIGPHWYAIIVMVGVIIGIGFGFAWMLTPRLEVSENQRKVQGLVGTILTGSFKVESDSPKPDYG